MFPEIMKNKKHRTNFMILCLLISEIYILSEFVELSWLFYYLSKKR